MKIVIFLLIKYLFSWDPFITTNSTVDRAIKLYKEKKYNEALNEIKKAKKELPQSPQLLFDSGIINIELGNFEDAEKDLLTGLTEVKKWEEKKKFLFALGYLYMKWASSFEKDKTKAPLAPEKWKRAVSYFEMILKKEPNNRECLKNMEIAALNAYPPCSKTDDKFEKNDTPLEAKEIKIDPKKGVAKLALKLCENNEDWFKVTLVEGDRLTVKYSTDDENLKADYNLYEPDGKVVLKSARKDEEEGVIKAGPIKITGQYLIGIRNVGDYPGSYNLDVSVLPKCSAIDDKFEDNDTVDEAKQIKPGNYDSLRICPDDNDYFKVQIGQDDSILAVMQTKPYSKEPAIEIINSYGEVIARAKPQKHTAIAFAPTPGEGIYFIHITTGKDVESQYSLNFAVVPPCPDGNDKDEPNNSVVDAKPLDLKKGGGLFRICKNDEDFYKIKVPKDQVFAIESLFDPEKGDIDMILYDESGEKVIQKSAKSTKKVGIEAVVTPRKDEEKTYFVDVLGANPDVENFYILKVTKPKPNNKNKQNKNKNKNKNKKQKNKNKKQNNKKKKQKKQEPIENQMKKMDRNKKNIEALDALRKSPYKNRKPLKDW